MTDVEKAWVAGAWSTFGVASARGRKQKPSLLLMGFTPDVPKALLRVTGLGQVMPGIRWRWVCAEPEEVQAFYLMLASAVPPCTEDRLSLIAEAWRCWRLAEQERAGTDPGPIDPADAAAEAVQIERELAQLRAEAGLPGPGASFEAV
jgi:hypothetical protein